MLNAELKRVECSNPAVKRPQSPIQALLLYSRRKMPSRYAQWMHDWETRLTSVDNNRVVRPLEWGLEWTTIGRAATAGPPGKIATRICSNISARFNDRIIQNSDEFYSYQKPADFRLERREVQVFSTREVPDPRLEEKVRGTHAEFLRFTSPVATPFPENNLVNARWFPARGRRAVVVLPHWNADGLAYNSLCRVLNWLGIAVLRLSMPYHDIRRPAGITAPTTPSPPTLAAPSTRCAKA